MIFFATKSVEKMLTFWSLLACGPGNITRYILHQKPNWKITATDYAEEITMHKSFTIQYPQHNEAHTILILSKT